MTDSVSFDRAALSMGDEDRRLAADAARRWAEEVQGPLEEEHALESVIQWRAYDLPA